VCKLTAQLPGSTHVCCMRFFRCIKYAEMNVAVVMAYLCTPRISPRRWIISHAFKAVFAALVGVLLILRLCGFAQVTEAIIGAFAIYMIDLLLRPATSHIKPSQPAAKIGFSINDDRAATVAVSSCSSNHADTHFWSRFTPSENARIGIVVKKFAQVFMRYHKQHSSLVQ